ncbi:MAG: PHP domain-containing protein [Pseudomonadales bacterium]
MEIDFHIHSCHSDGVLEVSEIIELARSRGLEEFSITDHDTLDAYSDVAVLDTGEIKLVPGCEFSSIWQGRTVHIVGLNLDIASEAMLDATAYQARAREQRSVLIAKKLETRGITGALEGAQKYAKGAALGRPHFASYLVDKGFAKDSRQAFKKFLGDGKVGDVKSHWQPVEEVVSWINRGGGVAVLAHPLKYGMTQTRLRELLVEFTAAGGRAIEVVSGMQKSDQTQQLARLARHFGLLASAGSDFHRPGQGWADLGVVQPLPEECVPVWSLWR